ncbi:MAG: hypothetical protein MK102_06370 [Fuerstiella sp.]|nr:hypothetical protein [Fuerstiella sp.]
MRGRIWLVPLIAVCVLVGLVFPFPFTGWLWSELFDLGHAPIFCALLLAFAGFLDPCSIGLSARYGQLHCVATAETMLLSGGCLLLGCMGEFLQTFVGRSPAVGDLVSNAAGVLSGVLWMRSRVATGVRQKLLVIVAFMILAMVTLKPALGVWGAVVQKQDFPLLASFERSVDLGAWTELQSTMGRTSEWASHGEHSLQLDLYPGRVSGIMMIWPTMDWRGYDLFTWDIHNMTSASVDLTLKIYDHPHLNRRFDSADHYEMHFEVPPTTVHSLSVKLADIAVAPELRSMNMGQIALVELVAANLSAAHTVLLDNMRLRIDESSVVDTPAASDPIQYR